MTEMTLAVMRKLFGELLDNFRMELVTKKNSTIVILQERETVLTELRSDHAA